MGRLPDFRRALGMGPLLDEFLGMEVPEENLLRCVLFPELEQQLGQGDGTAVPSSMADVARPFGEDHGVANGTLVGDVVGLEGPPAII